MTLYDIEHTNKYGRMQGDAFAGNGQCRSFLCFLMIASAIVNFEQSSP